MSLYELEFINRKIYLIYLLGGMLIRHKYIFFLYKYVIKII